jgi:pimeloyl-ACP methyl ester carboxylesterase
MKDGTGQRTTSPRRKMLFAVLAVGFLCAVAWSSAKAHLQSVAVLREVAGQPVPMLARSMTVPVTTEEISLPIQTASGPQQIRARIYTPKNWTAKDWTPQGRADAPAMVIFHGVHHLGIDEPRLTGFASALASCGIRVLTPELPGIKDYHVSQDSVTAIGESVRWFATQTGAPVGVMGLSFAGGLALVADADPQYHSAFKFIVAVGSQDSMQRVAEYYLSGRDARPDGSTEILPAHEYGPLVLEYEHVEDFVPAADLAPVRAVLRAHLYEDRPAEAAATLLLNDAQKREAHNLMDTTLPATRAQIAASIALHIGDGPGLSPQGNLHTLGTPVYLLHGQADNIIPSAETLWMANELQPKDLRAVLVSPVLSHLDLDGAKPGAMDEWRLLHFFARIIHNAESPTAR